MTGAIVSVFAVSTPSAAQTHWLPSRSEVSTSSISATSARLFADTHQGLAVFNQYTVAGQDLEYLAPRPGADRIHQLHDFDDADDGVLLDDRTHFDERGRTGFGGSVEGAQEGRGDLVSGGVRWCRCRCVNGAACWGGT